MIIRHPTVKGFSFASIDYAKFEEHISASIPGYNEIENIILGLSEYFVQENSNVYDLGCSTGRLVTLLNEKHKGKDSVDFIGAEIEPNFYFGIAKRFGYEIEDVGCEFSFANMTFSRTDICSDKFVIENASFITSVFTFQFLPLHKREELFKKIYNGLNSGGCLMLTEKVYACNAKFQDFLTFLYYDHKKKSFTEQEILDKERSLRRMMYPVTFVKLESLLKEAGFAHIETVWRNLNFVGVVAEK